MKLILLLISIDDNRNKKKLYSLHLYTQFLINIKLAGEIPKLFSQENTIISNLKCILSILQLHH